MNGRDGIDHGRLEQRVAQVSRAMAAHGGGIELVDADPRGGVRVRFTGLCAGCQLRPLTFAETIEPALRSVPGVRRVQGDGARISDEAMARLRHYHNLPPLPGVDGPRDGAAG
jgi:Fe-S cluster biogenesis protein NfuA